jgi:hypothetical protein
MARCFTVVFSAIAAVSLGCNDTVTSTPSTVPTPGGPNDPVGFVNALTVPGKEILSGTKSWIDNGKYYFTDVSNAGVDIFDAKSYKYIGRVPGFVGAAANAATSGPNAIVFTGDGKAWVSDGISSVRVVDVASNAIVATISTAIAACDNGTVHNCQRTNEIDWDPEHKIVFVQNPSPLDVVTGTAIDTYGTFISAVAPYPVLGTITFANRRGQEAPLYDASQHRFLTAVSGRLDATTTPATYYDQYIAVIDPTVRPFVVEKKFTIDCFALGLGTSLGSTFGINDPALAPNGKIVVPGCGKALIMDTHTGAITPITQIGGGNQTTYNSGDGRFYVTGADVTTGLNSLGVIDATTSTWLQSVTAPQATNPVAFAETNQIFAVVQVTAAQVATPATDNSACALYGIFGKGCIAVFAHVKP